MRLPSLCPALLLATGLLAGGCASTLSTLQTARTLPPGKVQVSAGTGLFVPGGQLAALATEGVQLGRRAAEAAGRGEPLALSEEEQQQLLTAGLALAVAPPGVSNELMARVGLLDGVDAGLRLSTSALRLDGKVRVFHAGDPGDVPTLQRRDFDVALGLGLSRHSFGGPAMKALELVQLDDFSRWDVEVPVYVSADFGDVFKLYAAPKYVLSRTTLDARLVESSGQVGQLRLPARVTSHFAGATLGMALGYRWAHVYAELTAGHTFSRPVVFGRERDLGGLTLFPVLGLSFKTDVP